MIRREDVLKRIMFIDECSRFDYNPNYTYFKSKKPILEFILNTQDNLLTCIDQLKMFSNSNMFPDISEIMQKFIDQFINKKEEEIRNDKDLCRIVFQLPNSDESDNKNDTSNIFGMAASIVKTSESSEKKKKIKEKENKKIFNIFNTF